ncbi:PE domain-containing protein, partial [Mycobacterium tuberculosis]
MSFVSVAPEIVVAAATDLAGIGSAISAANAAAAAPTTAVLAAGADEVSA